MTLYSLHNQHLSPRVSPCATQCNRQTGMDSIWEWLRPLCSQSQVRRSWNLWLCKDQTGNSPDGQQKQNHEQNISMHNETIILCLTQKMPSEKEYTINTVGKIWGGKLSRMSHFCGYSRKFSLQNLGAWCPLAQHERAICESFLRKSFLLWKFHAKFSPGTPVRQIY